MNFATILLITSIFNQVDYIEIGPALLWGIIKTKKLPAAREATHNTVNVSLFVDNFHKLFTPLIFPV